MEACGYRFSFSTGGQAVQVDKDTTGCTRIGLLHGALLEISYTYIGFSGVTVPTTQILIYMKMNELVAWTEMKVGQTDVVRTWRCEADGKERELVFIMSDSPEGTERSEAEKKDPRNGVIRFAVRRPKPTPPPPPPTVETKFIEE